MKHQRQRFSTILRLGRIDHSSTHMLRKAHPPLITVILTAAFALFAAEMRPAFASDGSQNDQLTEMSAAVEVLTEAPSTSEAVQIRMSGLWRNACVPEYQQHHVTNSGYGDSIVQIFAVAEPADLLCGQVETEWSFDIDIDLEDPGLYTVNVMILSGWDNSTQLSAFTHMWVNGSIGYQPEAPQINDDVTITVDGVNGDGCVPSYESHSVTENTIVIEAAKQGPDTVCGQVITPWSIAIDMGTIAEGSYDVEVYITAYPTGEPIRTLYQSTELLIGSQRRQQPELFYIPSLILR